MTSQIDTFSDESLLAESLQCGAAAGVLALDAEETIGRATSVVLPDAAAASLINALAATLDVKPGGTVARLSASDDGATYRAAGGADLSLAAYDLDGSDDRLERSEADFRSADTAGTVVVNFRKRADGVLFSSSDESVTDSYLAIRIVGGKLQIDHSGENVVQTARDLLDEVAYQAIIVSDGAAWNLYLDGQAERLSVVAGANNGDWLADAPSRDNIALGYLHTSSPGGYFDGTISRTSVYATPWTATDAQDWFFDGLDAHSANLVADWRMVAGAADSAGSYDLTVDGAAPVTDWRSLPATGNVLGQRHTLDFYADDFVSLPQPAYRSFASDFDWSIGFWMWVPVAPPAVQVVLYLSTGETLTLPNIAFVVQTGGGIRFVVRQTTNTNQNLVTDTTDLHGAWHYVVGTYTAANSQVELWVDAVSIGTDATYALSFAATDFGGGYVGCLNPTLGYYLEGRVAGLAFWNGARSSGQIAASFVAGFEDTSDAALLRYWPIDEGTGDTIADLVGTDHGTRSGAGWIETADRPTSRPPLQSSFDVSGLSYTNIYRRLLLQTDQAGRGPTVDQAAIDYDPAFLAAWTARQNVLIGGGVT